MIQLDKNHFTAVTETLGDTPFTVTPYFFLQRGACDVYTDDETQLQNLIVVPHKPCADIYVRVTATLTERKVAELADFLARLQRTGGLFVPAGLVQPLRARRCVSAEAEGLCFTYRRIPTDFRATRPERARRLFAAQAPVVAALPGEASFVYQNYGTPEALLDEGLAFGVFYRDRLVSVAASLALTPKHCDVGVYTLPRYRNLGHATDSVEALLVEVLRRGMKPLWRIGIRQRLAIYFAEKLGLEEIGTTGREVYLQLRPRQAQDLI